MSLHGKVEEGSSPVQADLDGKGSAENLFAIQDGKMISNKYTFSISGTANPSGQQMSNKIKLDVTTQMTLK